jgi:hypothetical protein
MERQVHYETVSIALEELKKKGFTIDYNLEDNCKKENFHPDDYAIVDIYRYEGITDPGDEAAVYAIESKNGEKGVLVTGYTSTSEVFTDEVLLKLKRCKRDNTCD